MYCMVIALLYDVHTTNAAIIPQDAVPVYAHCAEILNHKPIHKMKRRFALFVEKRVENAAFFFS